MSAEADALREKVRALQAQLAELTLVPKEGTPLRELADAYLADLEARTSPRHSGQVRSQLEKVFAGIPVETVEGLRPRHMVTYRNGQLAEGRSNRCANVHLQAIKGMLNWAHSMEEIPSNPLGGLKPLPTGERHATQHRRALSEEEITALLAAARAEDCRLAPEGYRVPQAPLFRALLETAARYGELSTAAWADVDLDERILTLRARNTKAGRKRTIPLSEAMVADLRRLPAYHQLMRGAAPSKLDRVFLSPNGRNWRVDANNLRRILRRLLVAAGIPERNEAGEKVDIHALRHTAITRFARFGVPLAQTQAIAGHSDPKLTARIYTHLELKDLRGAVEQLDVAGEKRRAREVEPVLEREAG